MIAERYCLLPRQVNPPPILEPLTPAELEVLAYVCAGYSTKEVAAFLGKAGGVSSVLTALDVLALARANHSPLVPNTLAYCAKDATNRLAGEGEAMAIAAKDASRLVVGAANDLAVTSAVVHPHFVDTRSVPWAYNPDMPQNGLKVLRISEETGHVTLVVRHNGEAPPHRACGVGRGRARAAIAIHPGLRIQTFKKVLILFSVFFSR
jgi:hypothetical protein